MDFILSEISKLSFDDREVVRISLAAEYWQNHLHELVQQPATEDEMSLSEIDSSISQEICKCVVMNSSKSYLYRI